MVYTYSSFNPLFLIMAADKSDYLVKKSNDLIVARYSMTVNEQRLLLACISQIDSRKSLDKEKEFFLTFDDVRDLFYDNESKNYYRDLKMAAENLFERKVRIALSDSEELLTRFVQSVHFDSDKKKVSLLFAEKIIPYLSLLEQNFTQYRLKNIARLRSNYAIRIYEFLVSWWGQHSGSCEPLYKKFEYEELRELLDLGEKYKSISQIKQTILNPAIKQINESTDFDVVVNYLKQGRTIRWIQFEFCQKSEIYQEENKKKQQRKKRSIENQAAKEKREAEALAERQKTIYQEAPIGSEFLHYDGTVWIKEAYGLRSPDKRIMPEFQAIESVRKFIFTLIE